MRQSIILVDKVKEIVQVTEEALNNFPLNYTCTYLIRNFNSCVHSGTVQRSEIYKHGAND
jgi:hypothetical protein